MKKKILSVLITVALILSFGLMAAPVAAADPGTPTIDGDISPGEWGESLCTGVGEHQSVTVYAQATTDALYLAFDVSDKTDNRGGDGIDVLDWNVGLVGDMTSHPWRYVLVSKIYPDGSWGDSWDAIDNGYFGSWADTQKDGYYSHIPIGLEMVTSFATGNRVTEFKVPMSLMFDGAHGWDGPSAGDVLLLGGDISGEDADGGNFEQYVNWPTGLDFGDADTYASILVPPPTKADILSGVPGNGLDKAPGLQKPFNPNSKAGDHAGKK